MRLPAEKIKAAILNSDAEVREAAVHYFTDGHSDDPSLMPLIIEACDRFGDAAFHSLNFLDALKQTADSVAWMIRQIEHSQSGADRRTRAYLRSLATGLRRADADALAPHESAIAGLAGLESKAKRVISYRISCRSLAPETLWERLEAICGQLDQDSKDVGERDEFGYALAEALARHPEHCASRVLEILNARREDWLEVYAVRIAGLLGLEEAAPFLLEMLDDWEAWTFEEAVFALGRMKSAALVERLLQAYYDSEPDVQFTIISILEVLHTDRSFEACLELLRDVEVDEELRGQQLQAVLMNFSSDGIEPARQFVLTASDKSAKREVREVLLVTSKLLGIDFPEFAAWTAQSKEERSTPLFSPGDFELDETWDDESSEGDFDDPADEFEDPLGADPDAFNPAPIVHHEARVGRNDRCPCGSGKKFKKCCLKKQSLR